MAREAANLLPAASVKRSDWLRGRGCLESQSRPATGAGTRGAAGGEDESESEDEKGCEAEAVAAGRAAAEPAAIAKRSGYASERNAAPGAELGSRSVPHRSDLNRSLNGYGYPVERETALNWH